MPRPSLPGTPRHARGSVRGRSSGRTPRRGLPARGRSHSDDELDLEALAVPPATDAPAFALWVSGWLVLGGLWTAALAPAFTLGALHLVFIGGFGLLTLGIATRVVVAHRRYPLSEELRVLSPALLMGIGVTLLLRLAAEWFPKRVVVLLGLSGALWVSSWLLWAWNAVPRLLGIRSRAS